jgi:CheY-like chemotaxis protein
LTILLVDDNLAMMGMYVDYLRSIGCDVHMADNGWRRLLSSMSFTPM